MIAVGGPRLVGAGHADTMWTAMDDISEQLAIRDSFRRKLNMRRTPAERMEVMARLQQSMWETFRHSPKGYAHFLRRNFAKRAIDVRGLGDA
jgi:hypothetical protein